MMNRLSIGLTRRSTSSLLTKTTPSVMVVGGEHIRWKSTQSPKPDPAKSSSSSSSSLLDSAAEYYSSLRWKFATTLTASLSPEEQSQLLNRLQVQQPPKKEQSQPQQDEQQKKEEAVEQHQHSIAEAVAAARAEEAKLQKNKWEKEKEVLLANAEKAAKERVENELLIQHRRLAFQRWEQELQEKQQQEPPKEEVVQHDSSPSTATEKAPTVTAEIVEEPIALVDEHPVLGTPIIDLGTKRVHMTSVKVLKSLPVWKKQRTYRHNRAKSMATDKLKTLHLGFPGIISLHEVC